MVLKKKLGMWQIACFLLFILFVISVNASLAVFADSQGEAYIYSFRETSSEMLSYFSDKSDWIVTHYDLNDSTYSEELIKIVRTLGTQGIDILPPEICLPCELNYFTWEEIYLFRASPLIGFFRNGKLTAITVAVTDRNVLDQALLVDIEDGAKVFTLYETFNLTEDSRIELEKVFAAERGKKVHTNLLNVLPLTVMAAAVDAVNPCEFYVLTVFLSFIFFRIGRKAVLKAGIAYSIGIFIMYYLMGFGLLQLITYVEEARILVVILGFSVGLRAVLNFLFGFFGLSLGLRDIIGTFFNRKFKRVPEFFSKKISGYLKRASENPVAAFAIGLVVSAFLLPCTSGPYLIAISLISNLETLLEGLLLLTVYNSIIIIPFLAITLGVYMLRLKTGELKRWSSERQRWLNLIAGLLMILLSFYLIFSQMI